MTSPQTQYPVADGVFTWPSDDPRLIGSRCTSDGVVTFPAQASCPRCQSPMEEALLEPTGTLWTWTVQGFLPKSPPYAGPESPESFSPYGVGYVELGGQVRVESRLEGDPAALEIGMPMELVIVPFRKDAHGNEVMTYAFRPVAAA